MPAGLSLTLLGGLHIALDGESLGTELTSKAAALLVYLSVTGRPHSRAALAGLFWGEAPETNARASLRTALAALNRHVASYLHVSRAELAFDPSLPHWVDALAFAKGLEQVLGARKVGAAALSGDQAAQLQELLDLYQGDFLADSAIYDAPPFEEWLISERERLRQLASQALYHLSIYYTSTASYHAGIAATERLLALTPWQEEAHRQLMRLLALDGRRSAALAQYETCCRQLDEELGVSPTVETTALFEQIRRGEIGRPAAQPPSLPMHNLPAQTTPFIGREEELVRLQKRLEAPAHRLVTIVGPGGVGKTRLALVGAERVLDRFSGGLWWVPFAEVDPGPVTEPQAAARSLATAIARALGLTFSGEREPAEQLLTYLRSRQLLLVLDSMEHLLAGVDFLLQVLQWAPQVELLVTSRERLNLQAEYVLGLKGLPVPAGVDDAGASDYSSVRLFAERAERTPAGFTLGQDNLPDVIRICTLVDGLPLGIELAATWVEQLGSASIAETIVQNLDFLETSLRDVPQRHRSMRAVFEGSWRLLNESEAAVLARCAVFQGGFGTAAALAVAGTDEDALAALAGKSLLRRPAAGRYEMHDLLRQFALEKLDEDEVYARHSAYYLDWLMQQDEALRGNQARRTVAVAQRDWGNVLQAWRWASQQGQPEVIRGGSPVLATLAQLSGLLQEGADLFAQTAADLEALLAERPDPELHLTLAAVLVEQAGLLNAQGWSEQAVAVARQAMQLAQHAQAAELEASAHLQRSIALFRQLDYAGARHSGRLARALAWEADSRQIEADSHLILGQVEHATGDYGVAQVYYERAFQLYRQVDHPRGEGAALMQLGALARAQADFAAAHRHYGRAREIFHQVIDRRQEGVVLDSLGQVAAQEGDYANAWDYDQQALAILREVGDNRAVGSVLTNMGVLLLTMGQYDRARAIYEQAQRLWREIGYRQGEARVLTGLACVTGRPGDYVAAEELARQSLTIAEASGERSEQARAMNCLARALAGQDRWEDAAGAYWSALAQRRELGEQAAAIESLAGLARVALARGDLAQAQAHVVEILAYLEKAGSFYGADDDLCIYLICCQVLEAVGDARAQQLLAAAHQLLEERVARIEDPEFRRSFLEAVAVNREIARLYQESTAK